MDQLEFCKQIQQSLVANDSRVDVVMADANKENESMVASQVSFWL